MTKQNTISAALSYFDEGYACSQSVLLAFAREFELDEKTAKLISSTFGGGMGRLREKCGAVTGGFMVLGLKYGNIAPTDMDTKLDCYRKVRDLNGKVKGLYGTTNCGEILKQHATESEIAERKHHKIVCRRVVGEVTEMVYEMIHPENITE
ncbi:MAG TPA: C-GCAxxG-C-C family protein [Prolixibacteraceae bacterium]|jgi:C_GCAxxG_C_C family probable redox protein|nr:C-GCAxxG-C-C family protein [Prolixibacteraceae bacterium]